MTTSFETLLLLIPEVMLFLAALVAYLAAAFGGLRSGWLVAVIGLGIALLLAGGAAGKRMALPNSRILIHQVLSGFQGQATDIEIHARETLNLRARLDQILAQHTGKSEEQIHIDSERDRFFTAEEAAEYGLVDRVIESH